MAQRRINTALTDERTRPRGPCPWCGLPITMVRSVRVESQATPVRDIRGHLAGWAGQRDAVQITYSCASGCEIEVSGSDRAQAPPAKPARRAPPPPPPATGRLLSDGRELRQCVELDEAERTYTVRCMTCGSAEHSPVLRTINKFEEELRVGQWSQRRATTAQPQLANQLYCPGCSAKVLKQTTHVQLAGVYSLTMPPTRQAPSLAEAIKAEASAKLDTGLLDEVERELEEVPNGG